MTFRIEESKKLKNGIPLSMEPKIIGYFSINNTGSICFDSSQLSYYYKPRDERIHFDLNQGIVKERKIAIEDIKIDNVLRWIINDNNVQKIKADPESGRWLHPNYICFRGVLIKIMKTPYDINDGWIICASKYRGNIYLCAFDTKADKHRKANASEYDVKCTKWGFKFEQYMLSDSPNEPPDTSKPIEALEEFCCMYQTCLSDHVLLYGAEMDGLLSNEVLTDPLPLEKLKFIEFKTNRVTGRRQMNNLQRFKFLRWWCQSYLVGIEDIVCGIKDDKGIVTELQDYKLKELVATCKDNWSTTVAMNFCNDFLSGMAKIVVNDYNHTIYKFERIPFKDIVITELPPTSEYAFLPEWYTKKYWSTAVAMNFCDEFLKYISKTVVTDYHKTLYKFERVPGNDKIELTELPPSSKYCILPEWYINATKKEK